MRLRKSQMFCYRSAELSDCTTNGKMWYFDVGYIDSMAIALDEGMVFKTKSYDVPTLSSMLAPATSDKKVGIKTILVFWCVVNYCIIAKQGEWDIIDSDNGLVSGRCQAIIWINAGINWTLWEQTSVKSLIKLYIFWFNKMHLKLLSGNWQPFCLGLNVLTPLSINSSPLQTRP